MIKTNSILKSFCIIGLLLILGVYFYYSVIRLFFYRNNAQSLIINIEKFRSQKGRCPLEEELFDSTSGLKNGSYYKYIDSNKYIVYYGIGFDNTYTYYSDKKEWKEVH